MIKTNIFITLEIYQRFVIIWGIFIQEKQLDLSKNREFYGILTCWFPSLSPWLHSSLEIQKASQWISAASGGCRIGLEPPKVHHQRIVIIWLIWEFPGNPHPQGLSLAWVRAHSLQTAFYLRALVKKKSGNCLTLQLPKTTIIVEGKRNWPKNWKEKLRNVHNRDFEKLRQKATHTCRAVLMPRKGLRRLSAPLLTDLGALHRKEVKTKAKLWTTCQSTECVSQLDK